MFNSRAFKERIEKQIIENKKLFEEKKGTDDLLMSRKLVQNKKVN